MAICTYDNPATMARESWQDGVMVCCCQSRAVGLVPGMLYFLGSSIGPWNTGQLVGDPKAMEVSDENIT